MEKEEPKDIVVAIGVEKNGHIKLETEAEQLPKEIVQEVLDSVVTKILSTIKPSNVIESYNEAVKESRMWRFIAIAQLIIFCIIIIIMKGR